MEQQETRRCLVGTIEQLGQPETMQFYRNNVKQTMQSFIGTKQNTKQKNNRKQANILSEQNKTSQQLIGTARNNLMPSRVNDCCLTPIQQFSSYIMARTS